MNHKRLGLLSQPFWLWRNCCPKEEREEEFSDIIVSSIDRYTLNHKLFIESFLEWNKTKYKWQGNSIIADFGKDGELKIDFEKEGDKLIFKELYVNEVK